MPSDTKEGGSAQPQHASQRNSAKGSSVYALKDTLFCCLLELLEKIELTNPPILRPCAEGFTARSCRSLSVPFVLLIPCMHAGQPSRPHQKSVIKLIRYQTLPFAPSSITHLIHQEVILH